jgi:voltage-gated potassium channel
MKSFLYNLVIDNTTRYGKIFDLVIQLLIILSLVTFSIETLPELDSGLIKVLNQFELVCVIIFSIEYILRLFLTPKFKYVFSFFGIIDLLAILPFYLASGIDLRSVRVLRLLRLFRVFKLFKYNNAMDRITSAFIKIKSELVIFLVATFFLVYLASVGIYYFENTEQPEQFKSVFHSLWWAITTLTTGGYGDVYPITAGGKIFTTFIVFIGLGLVAVPTGLLATAFSDTFKKD